MSATYLVAAIPRKTKPRDRTTPMMTGSISEDEGSGVVFVSWVGFVLSTE